MKQLSVVVLALAASVLLQSPRALAEPDHTVDNIEVIETPQRNLHDDNRARARQANAAAAVDAANRIVASMQLDLDIRLPGHTSILVASTR